MGNQDIKNIEWEITSNCWNNIMYMVIKDPVRVIQVKEPTNDERVRLENLDHNRLETVLDLSTDLGTVFNCFLLEIDNLGITDIESMTGLTIDRIRPALNELVGYGLLADRKTRNGIPYMEFKRLALIIWHMTRNCESVDL